MERYLEDENNYPGFFTTENVFPILEAYVHKDVLELFKPHGPTAFKADFNRTKAAIYGNSISELKLDLAAFRNFPGSLHKFGAKSRSYRNNVRKFAVGSENKDVETYIYKSGLFDLMAQAIPLAGLLGFGEYVVEVIEYYVAIYLRHKEAELLKGMNELVKVERAVFDKFQIDLIAQCTKKIEENKSKLTYANFRKAMKKIYHTVDKSLGPIVDKWITQVETNLSFNVNKSAYLWIQQYVTVFVTKVEAFIKQQKEWFTLNQKFEKLRLFKNGEAHFLLAKELHAEIRRSNYNGGLFEKELHEEKDILRTLSWKEAEFKWNAFVKNAPPLSQIVKIHYECTRTNHRAIFIPYCGNKHCILASDALLELMRTWFSVKGILQKVSDKNRKQFTQSFFYKLYDFEPKFFSMDRQHFLDVNRVESVNTWMETEMNGHFGPLLMACRDITPVSGTIDLEAVVERLKQTNIWANFPIIQNFYKIVYMSRMKKRKNILSLCDIYGISEQCQLLAFCATMSSIRRFLESHGQNKMYPTDCIEYDLLLLDTRRKLDKLDVTDKEDWKADQARAADIARRVAEAKAKKLAEEFGLPPPGPKKIESGSDEISDEARFNSPGYITLENITGVLKFYCEEDIYELFTPAIFDFEADYESSRVAYYADGTEDLYIQLDQFRGFPGCLDLCGFDSRTYRKKSVKYTFTNRNGTESIDFWYKQEAYLLLFDQLYRNELDRQDLWTTLYVEIFGSMYLRYKELQMLERCNEFTKEIEIGIFERFRTHLSKCFDKEEASEMEEVTLVNAKDALTNVLRNHFRPFHEGRITEKVAEIMVLLEEDVPIEKFPRDYKMIVHHTTIFVREAEKFINDNVRWFKKADKWEVIPRLFKHGNTNGFFIISELVPVLKQLNMRVKGLDDRFIRDRLSTISFDYVQMLIFYEYPRFEMRDLPVVPTEIIRTKHRAVPIPYDRKRHCIPAYDALLEMLRTWIRRGFFQNRSSEHMKVFRREFFTKAHYDGAYKMYKMVDPRTLFGVEKQALNWQTAPPLIDIGMAEDIHLSLELCIYEKCGVEVAKDPDYRWSELENHVLKDRKEVTPNTSDQFSYEDLEERARDLNLFKTFPDLGERLKQVYDNFKRPGRVTTNDIYEMLEHAQLLQIIGMFPEVKYWFSFNSFGVPAFPFTFDRYEARTKSMWNPPNRP